MIYSPDSSRPYIHAFSRPDNLDADVEDTAMKYSPQINHTAYSSGSAKGNNIISNDRTPSTGKMSSSLMEDDSGLELENDNNAVRTQSTASMKSSGPGTLVVPGNNVSSQALDLRRQLCSQNVFVFHLPSEWKEEQLKSVFARFGPIKSVKVVKRPNQTSKGYGFVCFDSPSAANRAVLEMDGFQCHNKRLKVSLKKTPEECMKMQVQALMNLSRKKEGFCTSEKYGHAASQPSLFIFHLPSDWTDETLFDQFKEFGPIIQAKVARKRDGSSRGYGFVTCSDPRTAALSIAGMNGREFGSKRLKVQPKQQNVCSTNPNVKRQPGCTIFVFHVPNDWTEQKLAHAFAPCGKVVSAVIQRDGRGNSRGFGFVTFEMPHEAVYAVQSLNGSVFGSKRLKVSFKKGEEFKTQQQQPETTTTLQHSIKSSYSSSGGVANDPRMMYPHETSPPRSPYFPSKLADQDILLSAFPGGGGGGSASSSSNVVSQPQLIDPQLVNGLYYSLGYDKRTLVNNNNNNNNTVTQYYPQYPMSAAGADVDVSRRGLSSSGMTSSPRHLKDRTGGARRLYPTGGGRNNELLFQQSMQAMFDDSAGNNSRSPPPPDNSQIVAVESIYNSNHPRPSSANHQSTSLYMNIDDKIEYDPNNCGSSIGNYSYFHGTYIPQPGLLANGNGLTVPIWSENTPSFR